MGRKFNGSYAELQDRVLLTGMEGRWRDLGNQKQFFADNGAVLNWWESSHTLFMQGREPGRTGFERSFWTWEKFVTDAKRVPR